MLFYETVVKQTKLIPEEGQKDQFAEEVGQNRLYDPTHATS